ncbi:MAG: hypothetical protein OXG29_09710 [Gammaproteobacteria bacterium]|nr:hypothetical protein [Gammaproteobacteria bacterium]
MTAAIEFLEPGKPLVLSGGFLVTDGGHLILSQYVDIGVNKLTRRPSRLVKFIEAKYGLEHASDIQLSAPYRFRDYGETFIQDDQEGHAHRETRTESPPQSYEEHSREQERALSLLGQRGITITNSETPSVQTKTESFTFGRSSWIYCTAIETTPEERSAKLAKLPRRYEHDTVIRQPGKFALTLGEMLADQRGPQGKRGDSKHPAGLRSFHNTQLVLHGPVWYTDDVLGFLESRRSEPLYYMYPLFLKHSEYQDQQEYRFVLHCETPVESETLLLNITGALRDSIAPTRTVGHVTYQRREDSSADSSGRVSGPTPTHLTMTQTRNSSNRRRRTLSIEGEVAREEIITSEQKIVLTTELPAGGVEHAGNDPETPTPREGTVTESETRERRIAGEITDRGTSWRTRTFTVRDPSDAELLFSLEERDNAAEILKAARRPFEDFSALPKQASEALSALVHQAALVEPDLKMQAMSACWNGIWAICNLHECYGDVVASVGIENGEFVAVTLKRSEDTGAEGKILVGPRGTFAYLLTRGDEKRPGHGGTRDRIVFFPNEETRVAFEEFGWTPLQEETEERN